MYLMSFKPHVNRNACTVRFGVHRLCFCVLLTLYQFRERYLHPGSDHVSLVPVQAKLHTAD